MPLPDPIVQTVLIRLATLFLAAANGEEATARLAASQMLDAYNPQGLDELRLAASLICFSFQSLEALAQSARADVPVTHVMRLRAGAVSLSREAARAEIRLGQLQKARLIPAPDQRPEAQPGPARPEPAQSGPTQPEPAQARPTIENPVALAKKTGPVAAFAKANNITWTQAYNQRQRDIRIAANAQRTIARNVASEKNPTFPSASPPPAAPPSTPSSQVSP